MFVQHLDDVEISHTNQSGDELPGKMMSVSAVLLAVSSRIPGREGRLLTECVNDVINTVVQDAA